MTQQRLVHIQSTVQAVFGLLDDEGNAVPQPPVTIQVAKLTGAAFQAAAAQLMAQRDRMAEQLPKQEPAGEEPNGASPPPARRPARNR